MASCLCEASVFFGALCSTLACLLYCLPIDLPEGSGGSQKRPCFCASCQRSLSSRTLRMHMDFNLCGSCGRGQSGKPTVFRLSGGTTEEGYKVSVCKPGEKRWEDHACDFCGLKITGVSLYRLNYDVCEDCFYGDAFGEEVRRWTSSFVLGTGKASFGCEGCDPGNDSGRLRKIYLPNFFVCQSCAARPHLMPRILARLPCGAKPGAARFTDWLGTDSGGAMGGHRGCHVCSSLIPKKAKVLVINYGLCEDCRTRPADHGNVRAHFRAFFRRGMEAGERMPANHHSLYTPLEALGSGSFGDVYKVKSTSSNVCFARKTVNQAGLTEAARAQMLTEERLLLELKHPNILEGVDAYHDSFRLQLHIVMELGMADLSTFLKTAELSRALVYHILTDVTKGVAYLHNLGVIHRDIKPANILVFQEGRGITFKLGDLGIARHLSSAKSLATSWGTPMYSAPEMLTSQKGASPASDMWAVGCVLFEVLFADSPFWDPSDGPVQAYSKMKSETFNIPAGGDPNLVAIMKGLLRFSPRKRLTPQQVLGKCGINIPPPRSLFRLHSIFDV